MYCVQRYIVSCAQLCHESLIAVALFTSEVEIAVHGLATVAQSQEHSKQRYRVGTAAERNKNLASRGKQHVLRDILFYLMYHDYFREYMILKPIMSANG